MLFIGIPAFDEAPTIGVLLWKIRQVFATFSREFEIVVYDDASADSTAETLEPYARVLPLTVIRGEHRLGYAGALDRLMRAVATRSRYPRRDALITMQGDFTDQPEHIPELVKRFEGGADLVVGDRAADGAAALPPPVRRLHRVAPWVLRPFVAVPGVSDPFGAFRLYRIALVRDMIRAVGDAPLSRGTGWSANVDLLLRATPLARRVETVSLPPRYDLRPRASRVKPLADAVSLYRFARHAQSHRKSAPRP
ncbi:MAG TPA: glycosyltransferase family 2 protein [Gemmatimonadaceae bacterium]|nr:glycosyltransferase family 2 protein [Gemmatimonadaceae bacterium]